MYTSIFLGHVQVHESEGVRLLDDVPGELAGAVVVRRVGDDLLARELLGQVDDLALVVVQGEVVARLADGGGGRGEGPRRNGPGEGRADAAGEGGQHGYRLQDNKYSVRGKVQSEVHNTEFDSQLIIGL